MNAKGISYVVSKANMTAAFGEKSWADFMAKLAKKDSYFGSVIMSITPMPVEKLIVFFDEMCAEFFNNDKSQYEKFGKAGAKAVLAPEGPYRTFMLTKDLKQFVESVLPKVWATYFDSGVTTALLVDNVAHVKITGIDIKHNDFENMIMGYFQQALKMFGKKSTAKKIRSLASGDKDIYYQYELRDA
ncbi:MAG TPA: hypothetical protein VMU29_10905 [Smithella sp.]|nr:hypothetical protein [Smithella sp.]